MRAARTPAEKLILAAGIGCLLIPFFISVLRPSLDPLSVMNLNLSLRTNIKIEVVEENSSISDQSGTQMIVMPLDLNTNGENKLITSIESLNPKIKEEREQEEHRPQINDGEAIQMTLVAEEKKKDDNSVSGNEMPNTDSNDEQNRNLLKEESTQAREIFEFKEETNEAYSTVAENMEAKEVPEIKVETKEAYNTVAEKLVPQNNIQCDLSQTRSDTCVMHGDVRVHGLTSSIILAKVPEVNASEAEIIWKIRPYARKWEPPVMELIRELSLKSSAKPEEIPRCSIKHNVPAIVFSTGGFLGNFFHDFTDVLIPLFITSYQYKGEVQFLVNNFNYPWIKKYSLILKQLSRYGIIDLDLDERVHCFQDAHIGLLSHEDLIIDSSKSPNGYSMADFKEFMRTCFSLKRKSVRIGNNKPRLLIVDRKGARELTNRRQLVSLAKSLGYKVVVAGPGQTKNLSQFAQIVNSCDVMMGVHGAGLTNMMFLPDDASLIQVIPWGGLKYACSHDFGDPAPSMQIKYLEYEISEEESSLIKQYPRDHPVFTDPLSIHRQGWNALWDVFLNKQSVKLDVKRFKATLREALQSIPH